MKQHETIGQRLKRYRIENDLTIEQVAEALNRAVSTVYRIENDIVEPSERTACQIEKLLTAA